MEKCPCGSGKSFSTCCEPIITGTESAQTAVELMRARYSAFVTSKIEFILDTIHPEKKAQHDERTLRSWAEKSQWLSIEILRTEKGGPSDTEGQVEFIARYRRKEKKEAHHEIASFKKNDNRWFFYDGEAPNPEQYVREQAKVGRNDPCPCGSGKKFKKCCSK